MAGRDRIDRHADSAAIGVLASVAMLHKPFGFREISALIVTLGGIALAMRS